MIHHLFGIIAVFAIEQALMQVMVSCGIGREEVQPRPLPVNSGTTAVYLGSEH